MKKYIITLDCTNRVTQTKGLIDLLMSSEGLPSDSRIENYFKSFYDVNKIIEIKPISFSNNNNKIYLKEFQEENHYEL